MNSKPIRYFIYCRKSSEDEDRQILSIDAQLSELNRLSAESGLTIVDVFTESQTAKEAGRPVFDAMIRRIEGGQADGIISWKLDRIARNFDDGGKIISLLQRGVIREIRTFERKYLPSDNVIVMAVEFGMANQYVRDLSTNVRRGLREKLRRGVFPGRAPVGYVNDPKLRTIEPHPENFAKIRRLLELFATGHFTLTAIDREFKTAGILGRSDKGPLRLSAVAKVLRNPFYYGVFKYKGEAYEGSHTPMITKETFDQIQEALVANGKPRKHRGEKGFRFLNFATCYSCGHAITAERHIKRTGRQFSYYRCTHKNKSRPCQLHQFVRAERFALEVKRNVERVAISNELKGHVLEMILNEETKSGLLTLCHLEQLRSNLGKIKSKIDRLNVGFTSGVMELEEFKGLKNPLVTKKVEIEQKLTTLETTRIKRLEPLRALILEANEATKWVLSENWPEMKSFLQRIGSNRQLRAQTLTVSFKKPWSLLAKTVAAVRGAPNVLAANTLWCRFFDEARTSLMENADHEQPEEISVTE